MLALRYIFVAVFVFHSVAWLDNHLTFMGWFGWPEATLSEMALTAIVIVLTVRPLTIHIHNKGSGYEPPLRELV